MVTSEWRKNVLVPIPKKKSRGVCRVDDFRSISLVVVLYKAMCSIVQCRLIHCGRKTLVVEEQGGFRKGRGYRDQLMMLLGQIKAVSRSVMFASFIDFKKAYDRVDRGKLWVCSAETGIRGWLSTFLMAVYT